VERRTAIAFGFLVQKFDLFLALAAPFLASRTRRLLGPKFGNIAALALIILGTAMIAIAAIRFLTTGKTIDSEALTQAWAPASTWRWRHCWSFWGCCLFVHLSHALVAKR
jgi:uncharacterized membrane protein YidH (DUF202 family)